MNFYKITFEIFDTVLPWTITAESKDAAKGKFLRSKEFAEMAEILKEENLNIEIKEISVLEQAI